MNIIQLCGGLGNQLFQYAFGRAQMANGILDVRYDTTWYKKFGQERPYILDKFCTNVKIEPFASRNVFKEKEFNLNLLHISNRNFSGYWQYLAYYENILPILRKEFCIREGLLTADYLNLREQIIGSPSVSIHVRRGDYVNLKEFQVMPLSYYLMALEYVKGNIYVFSDDIQWCKNNFKADYFSREITFVDLDDYLDFELMKLCKHNIIAPSSFSWWAAYLNDNPGKIVVAPKEFIVRKRDRRRYNNRIHYPKKWVKL